MEAMAVPNSFSAHSRRRKTDRHVQTPNRQASVVGRRSQIVVWEPKPDCQRGALTIYP
jgi:hypothetical protein